MGEDILAEIDAVLAAQPDLFSDVLIEAFGPEIHACPTLEEGELREAFLSDAHAPHGYHVDECFESLTICPKDVPYTVNTMTCSANGLVLLIGLNAYNNESSTRQYLAGLGLQGQTVAGGEQLYEFGRCLGDQIAWQS